MESKFGYKNNISSNLKKKIEKRCEELGLLLIIEKRNIIPIKERTKQDLFDNRSN